MNVTVPEGYKQTKVGVIPEDWEVVKIKEATTYVDYRGKTPIKTENGIFLVTAKNIKQGFIDYQASSEFVSEIEYHEIMRRGIPKIGDVLITTEAPLGNVAQIDQESIALAQRVIKFRAKKNVKNDFLKHYFLSNRFQSYLYRMAIGTTVLGIKGKELHNMLIPLPSLKEQEKIVEILTTWDEAITKQEELIKAKELQKKGLMQKLLSGEVRFREFGSEALASQDGTKVPFPSDWEEVRLGEIGEFKKGTAFAIANLKEGNIPVIAGGKEPAYYHNEYNRIGKTITVSSSGASAGFINYFEEPIFVSDSFSIKGKQNISNIKYLFFFLSLIQNKIFSLQSGGAQPHIYPKDLQKLHIKLPPLPEQQKIAEVLSLADDEINLLQNELAELKQQKKGLMQKLLTGKVRVKV